MPAPPRKLVGPGWVYILTNPAFPHMVKIGLTTRNPTERAAELTTASGVPLPFKVAWARAVRDCAAVEFIVHRMLDDRRVSGKREFFRIDVTAAQQVIEAAAGMDGVRLGRKWKPPPRAARRPWKGRKPYRRGGDSLPALMGLSAAALVVVLAFFHPPLSSWLPGSVLTAFSAIERLRS